MKKYILIVFLFISVVSQAQFNMLVDTLRVNQVILMDTNQIKQVDTATDDYDAVPLFQVVDSINGIIGNPNISVDATNISNVQFTRSDGTFIYESFGHLHNEYALVGQSPDSVPKVDFYRNLAAPAHRSYRLFADTANNTIGVYIEEPDVTGQLMRELWLPDVEANVQMDNGTVVYIDTTSGSVPVISKAKADIITTANGVIGVVTHDAEINTIAVVTTNGLVRDVNTSGMTIGETLYVSASTAGGFTNTMPEYPNYVIKVGTVMKVGTTDGEINVNVVGIVEDIIFNAFNGDFLESFDFGTTVTGGAIKGYLKRSDASDYLTMNFSDGFTLLDVSPADTITLTPGTDTDPQLQYVYVLKSTKVLTVSTSFWPSAEHIPVAVVALQSIATTSTNGALRNQNINDHIAGTDGQGHISHIGKRIRKMSSAWESGTEGAVTIVGASSPDDVYVAVTGGMVWQMHLQTFPAQDMQTGDDIHVVNDFTTPYTTITNLNTELTDAENASLSGRSFSFVVWGVINKTGQESHLMLNLPTGSYSSGSTAITDALGYSVYSIPKEFEGVGFLIARFTFSHSAAGGGTWTLQDTEDLRGTIPNISAGGGTGGVGVTTFLGLTDVPNSYSGEAGNIPRVAAGETALEFSVPAETVVNGGDSIITQDVLYDYVTEQLPFKVYRSETTLTALQVGALGVTPVVLLAAPGASNYYNILNVTAKVIVTTQLEVGSQVLQIGHNSGANSLTSLSNSALESSATVLHYCWLQGTAASTVIKVNDNFGCVLSGGANPSSGSAEIRITIYYTIETY
jgi:hypothetical protein